MLRLFVTPLYLQAAYRLAPAAAGLIITVVPLALGVMAPLAGLAAGRFGSAVPAVTGSALVAAGLAVAAGTVGDRGVLVGMLAVAGAGLGLFIPANNATVAGAGRPQQAGIVSGVLNMTRGVGAQRSTNIHMVPPPIHMVPPPSDQQASGCGRATGTKDDHSRARGNNPGSRLVAPESSSTSGLPAPTKRDGTRRRSGSIFTLHGWAHQRHKGWFM